VDPADDRGEHPGLNASILDLGVFLARMERADLHVLFAWTPWGESLLRHRMRAGDYQEYVGKMRSHAGKRLTELLRPYDEEIPLMHRHFVEGEPEDELPEFVARHEVDVVVMGTVGRTGVPGLFIGNTAERILRGVECSVLAVKPQGFVSPVELEEEA
jgi:nucleotide-binding universal stress UspA family protein